MITTYFSNLWIHSYISRHVASQILVSKVKTMIWLGQKTFKLFCIQGSWISEKGKLIIIFFSSLSISNTNTVGSPISEILADIADWNFEWSNETRVEGSNFRIKWKHDKILENSHFFCVLKTRIAFEALLDPLGVKIEHW